MTTIANAAQGKGSLAMTTTSEATAAVERVRDVLERHLKEGSIAGAVALVARGDNAQITAVGARALGSTDPMRRDTIFRIASLTKPITAAAAMMLIEEGKIRLDEPIDRLLPELAHRRVLKHLDGPLNDTVPARRPITVEDLLTFRLGLGAVLAPPHTYPIQHAIHELGLMGFGPPDPTSPLAPDEWIRRLSQLPLMAQPGETWLYTAGSNVLGVLIARAESKPLPQVLKERVFVPLGMADTGFFVPEAKHGRFAAAYRPAATGLQLYDGVDHSGWGRSPAFPAGDSGLVSTIDDYFAFSRMLSRHGRPGERRLLSDVSIRTMTRDHLTTKQREEGRVVLGPNRGWGYGLAVHIATSPDGVPVGAFGWDGGSGTSWRVDPATDRTVIVLTQTEFASPEPPAIHKDVWRSVFTTA
jgi:CubicO group peptidase (beta-lactamase class C family)